MIPHLPTRAQQSFDYRTANRLNQDSSLYPTFVVYLTTIGGRFLFHEPKPNHKKFFQNVKELKNV
jgi:hypothetical protein